MIRIFSLIITTLIIVGTIIMIIGYTANPAYTESVEFRVDTLPSFVWEELVNIQNIAQKKSDVASVEIVSTQGQLIAWQENLKNGGYRLYRMNEYFANQKLVIELLESSYGLTGIWEIELKSDEYSTIINITERSILDNVQKRGVRTIFGRNHDLLVWLKYTKVGVMENLLRTP